MRTLLLDDSASTLLEYGLVLAVIAVVAIVGVTSMGQAVKAQFHEVCSHIVGPNALSCN